MSTFFEQQQAELDRDHLEDLARVFRDRARVEQYTIPRSETYDGDEVDAARNSDTGYSHQEHGTNEVFSSERMQHIAGVQNVWTLPLKVGNGSKNI